MSDSDTRGSEIRLAKTIQIIEGILYFLVMQDGFCDGIRIDQRQISGTVFTHFLKRVFCDMKYSHLRDIIYQLSCVAKSFVEALNRIAVNKTQQRTNQLAIIESLFKSALLHHAAEP